MISKKDLKHLGELARIEIPAGDEEKLLRDLEEILNYFDQLKEVNTDKVEPVSGGTLAKNVYREDVPRQSAFSRRESAPIDQFPEKEKGFLKVPPVFE